MSHSDDQIKLFLASHGVPWDRYVLLNSKLPAYRDERGRLMTLLIEDDALYAEVQKFLIRHGQVEDFGNNPKP